MWYDDVAVCRTSEGIRSCGERKIGDPEGLSAIGSQGQWSAVSSASKTTCWTRPVKNCPKRTRITSAQRRKCRTNEAGCQALSSVLLELALVAVLMAKPEKGALMV